MCQTDASSSSGKRGPNLRECEVKFTGRDGLELHAHEWRPDVEPAGVVCTLHGLGEHGGQYVDVANALVERGVALMALDLRGHGRSGGERGHTPSYGVLLDDIDGLLAEAARRHPVAPLFLYGHSLGGNLVLNHALRRKPDLAGIVATSPWLWLTNDLAWWKRILATILEPFWPRLSFATRADLDQLDQVGVRRDPDLFHNRISVRLLMQVRRAGKWAARHADRLAIPVFLLHGEADSVTDPRGSLEFSRRAGAICETRFLPGVDHNPHVEEPVAVPSIADWIVRRIGGD